MSSASASKSTGAGTPGPAPGPQASALREKLARFEAEYRTCRNPFRKQLVAQEIARLRRLVQGQDCR